MKRLIFILLSIIGFMNIFLWPVNEYEWMLEDNPAISLPIDPNTGFYAFITVMPLAIVLLVGFLAKAKNEKIIDFFIVVFLFAIWFFKYGSAIL
ncbi:MAG: hypothetical protein MI799_02815 [Desulfobacterales bacterium]|nr:hypothetical protein [Desulfobacterales bacterium]